MEVLAAPTAIYFRCHDTRDFKQILKIQANLLGQEVSGFISGKKNTLGFRINAVNSKVDKCLLAEADGMVIAEDFGKVVENVRKVSGSEEEVRRGVKIGTEAIFRHEEQHSVQEIFEDPEGASLELWTELNSAETKEEKQVLLYRYLREDRKLLDARAKGELLAYLTGEMNADNAEYLFSTAEKNFRRGGAYGYPLYGEKEKRDLLAGLGEGNRQLIEDSLEKIFGNEYKKIARNGIIALKDLLAGDYSEASRNRARNLLSTVPLGRWPREVRMFLKH